MRQDKLMLSGIESLVYVEPDKERFRSYYKLLKVIKSGSDYTENQKIRL